ncbi:MAG TPA: hypothetical protein VFU05_17510 [Cyclobacteriaceae bacterium]|nr:hypothetical protein [Cyclobacteriaceae bacterium]
MIKKKEILVARSPVINLGRIEGKPTTFKFPYSRSRVHLEPEFIPKDKKKAELIIGMYFCQIHLLNLNHNVQGVRLNEDDSAGQADIFVTESGKELSVQITRLTFTDFETRKSIAKKKSIEYSKAIWQKIQVDFPLIVTIFPRNKHKVPLNKGTNRRSIEGKLLDLIVSLISSNHNVLAERTKSFNIDITDEELKEHFYSIDLCPVPQGMFANVFGFENIFVNYNFYGSTYDSVDAIKAVEDLYQKKSGGTSEILLIWANSFEIHDMTEIVETLRKMFSESTFKEVQLMTFDDNVALFRETLKLWGIKPSPGQPKK